MNAARLERRLPLALFAVCLAVHVGFSHVGWDHSLIEAHDSRQAQTALTAASFQRDGWKLAYPLPVFGPPWSAPMEFPTYQTCVAWVSTATGLGIVSAARWTSLGFFYATLPALFLLLGVIGLPPARRWLALAAALLSPLYLYYSRAVLIESCALFASAWFLWAYIRSVETLRPGWIAAAGALGALAAATKVTSWIVFLVPAALFTVWRLWSRHRLAARAWWRPAALALLAALPGAAAALAWNRFADEVKSSNPLSLNLTSANTQEWVFGRLAQRWSPDFWAQIATYGGQWVLSSANVIFCLAFAFVGAPRHRAIAWVLLLCYLAGPLVFANLYFVHDYYQYANSVFLLALLAWAWSAWLDRPGIGPLGRWTVVVASLAALFFNYATGIRHMQARPDLPPPELAAVLQAATQPDDVVLIYGQDWSPLVPYYAERRAVMVPSYHARNESARREVLRRLPAGQPAALVEASDEPSLLPHAFFPQLATELGLNPNPVAFTAKTRVYLRDAQLPAALPRLLALSLREFRVEAPVASPVAGVALRRFTVARLPSREFFDMMNPAPEQVIAPFDLGVAVVDGQRMFNAHAPTDIDFALTAAPRHLTAAYGLVPDAYAPGRDSDGVEFRVEWVAPSGEVKVLFTDYLDPSHRPPDRGLKQLDLALPADTPGRLILRTLPGPVGNISFDWAFWGAVHLR